ncbi:hypothetical protein [Bacillus thuringiensis]|uniref:Uncharacterized protein n=1 Tax=Bacillus thuringiensis serovar andalousiensis TaxID=257985 RepID=A0A6H0TPS6_BACTU|nr:hypothetical protein [Bacillus thuringiensis]QIW22439.1 hypothetical protein EVG22_31080 [Bacillus thuringiensis serovar andalousiensis]
MLGLFVDVGEYCDICADAIPVSEESTMYIEGLEKTLCKQCSGQVEQTLKVLDYRVIHDVLKELIKMFGRGKVRQFDLVTAERYVIENEVVLTIEKRGGKFNQEPLGEFIDLSNQELVTVIEFLKRKINPNLWMNAVIGNILDRQLIITLGQAERRENK